MTSACTFSFLSVPLAVAWLSCFNPSLACSHPLGSNPSQQSEQLSALQRGLLALKEDRVADALRELTAAEQEHPNDPVVRNFRGIVLVRVGQSAGAAAEYREAIRLNPSMEDAYRNLGFLEWTEHQLASAREALQRALQLSPDDSFAQYYLGRVELDAHEYSPAIRELETSRVPLPTDANFSIQMAGAYLAVARNEEARKLLSQSATKSLDDAQRIRVATMLLALHDNDSAIALIQRASDRPPASENSWRQFDLALAYLFAGKYQEAIDEAAIYSKSLTSGEGKRPESADIASLTGIAYARLKQHERSINALRRAAEVDSVNEEHWLNLTRELMDLNRYADAISATEQGIAANPKSYALHLRLGAAHLAAGHYAEAERVFRELVIAGDPLPTGYVGLAQVMLRTGRAEEALAELTDAEQKIGASFLISYFRGLALERAGNPDEALAAFQQAVRLDPNNAEAHLSLGKTLLNLGRVKDAITELQESLRLSPDNDQAKRLLSKAYSRAGDSKRAASFAGESNNAPAGVGGSDLVGDFFVPQWQMPPDNSRP